MRTFKEVPPHDLEGICRSVGMTLRELSEDTSIPEDELRAVAEGRLALCAIDRYAIITRIVSRVRPKRREAPLGADDPTLAAARTLELEACIEDLAQEFYYE